MCGIAGFLRYRDTFECENDGKLLKRMISTLAHRGPDDEGIYLNKYVGLAHRRLSIIDLAGGKQPMLSADERFITVFNGEIYNYIELKNELVTQGVEFKTSSDTEVIAECIRLFGIKKACLKMRGMFAFAVYDTLERKLFLARDRTGIKPLYYALSDDNTFLFASEQKAILTWPSLSRKINYTGLNEFFTLGFPVTPRTCWDSIYMFPPGHYCVLTLSPDKMLSRHMTIKPVKFIAWEPQSSGSVNEEEILFEIENVLKDSLRYHLRADVPIAAFLSGGIDSSLLTAFIKDGLLDNLKTFNVGFEETTFDESAVAAEVARITGTEHHKLTIRSQQADENLFESVLRQYDEPYGDSSCIPTYLICREMRKYVKTVISGDGGDELFGGYERYLIIELLKRISSLPAKRTLIIVLNMIGKLFPYNKIRQIKKLLEFASSPEEAYPVLLHTYFSESEKKSLYTHEFLSCLKSSPPVWQGVNKFAPVKFSSQGEKLALIEIAFNLHADYLRKVDIASSAHGLEVRVPMLDNKVIDMALKIPFEVKIKNRQTKYLLRKLVAKYISPEIAVRKKQGFGIPLDSWCSSDNMKKYLSNLFFGSEAENGILKIVRKDYLENLWSQFIYPDTRDNFQNSRHQVYQKIFMLASIQIWLKTFKPIP